MEYVIGCDETVIRGVIDACGHKHQTVVAMEELAELSQQLAKCVRGLENHDHLVEEFADVIICLIQVKEMYNIEHSELQQAVTAKMNRLDNRLKNHD